MEKIVNWILPLVIVGIVTFGLLKGINVFDVFVEGASKGLGSAVKLLPVLTGLVLGVGMLRCSGALAALSACLEPIARLSGIPSEVLPLALLSPVSGSGSLTMYEQILTSCGPDSPQGRIASVLMGSTETTFYAITVYYGSVGVKKSGCTIPAALMADAVSFILSAVTAGIGI